MKSYTNQPWWQTGVFYIIYVRSFKDATGDGVGDLTGVIEKLDYLSNALGIDAIWIAGVLRSPMADFGYDVSNYTDIEPLFGDLATYKELIEQAHKRGLKVIVDYIPNHSSDQHSWFLESRSSCDNPKRDWYIWADAKADGSPPNNWLSIFGGSAWKWDEATSQYYMHSFLKEQPDLNWRKPVVKEAMFDVARFWLELGADGFRIDCAHHIMKDPQMRDNPPNPHPEDTAYKPLGGYDSQLHLYDREHPDLHEIWREFRRLLDEYSLEQPRAAFGEIHVFDWSKWVSYYGQNLDELHMPFNLGLVGVEWKVRSIRNVVDSIEKVLPSGAWPNYMLGNFDESRVASRYGPAQARIGAMMLLTLRGTPMLTYGEEIGMTDTSIFSELQQDPFGIRVHGLGRDPYRTPMQWNSNSNAGFSDTTTPNLWLPLASNYKDVNVESQLADSKSILNLYRRLLSYRKDSSALKIGNYEPKAEVTEDCYVYLRQSGDQRILVALNFADHKRECCLSKLGRGKIVISTYLDREEQVNLNKLLLRSNEGVIVELL